MQKFVEEFALKIDYVREIVIEQSGHGTVTIGSVEKYINDTAWEKGWVKPIKVKELKQSIGIIGAGPAGMACAEELRKSGYQVTIYDRYDRPEDSYIRIQILNLRNLLLREELNF